MPIVNIELVCESKDEVGAISAQALADALGLAFGNPPGRTWVRLRILESGAYAENGVTLAASELPAFVTILHAHPPSGSALAAEAAAVTEVVAQCIARPPEQVHVEYAPAGAGRQAFGGHLVE